MLLLAYASGYVPRYKPKNEFGIHALTHSVFPERRDFLENLISIQEAAKRLGGISVFTIQSWLSRGILVRTKVGNRTMIRESELQKVINDGGKSPAPKRQHTLKRSGRTGDLNL